MKKYRPVTPSLRHVLCINFVNNIIKKSSPIKHLSKYFINNAGRNNLGVISVRHKGGGSKHLYRVIDFKRQYYGIPAKIISLEYDPNRSSFIALVAYINGFFSYILAPFQININSIINSSKIVSYHMSEIGNHGIIYNFSPSTIIHNLENNPGCGGKFLRSAGCFGLILRKKNIKYSVLKLKSKEKRYIHNLCHATIGAVSNFEHRYIKLGKAGRSRYFNIRPTVRGVAMNPVDHPHGGDTSSGKIHMTPWSFITKGKPTRRRANKLITTF